MCPTAANSKSFQSPQWQNPKKTTRHCRKALTMNVIHVMPTLTEFCKGSTTPVNLQYEFSFENSIQQ